MLPWLLIPGPRRVNRFSKGPETWQASRVKRDHEAWLVDLDGTLYRGRPMRSAMLAELLLQGRSAIPTLRNFRQQHERLRREQGEPHDSPFRVQIEATARTLGKPPHEVEQTVEEWMHRRPGKWLRYFRRRSLLREIVEFRRAGGRTALVSDYPARSKLEALDCSHLFDVVVASGEELSPRWLKPHPDGYLRAAEALLVSPAHCLVLGDRPDADGLAAEKANMAYRRIG